MKDNRTLIREMEEKLSETLLSEREKADLISSVLTGRPILIIGPRGVDKENVASIILEVLDLDTDRVNCSSNLRNVDLFGDVDPLALKEYGFSDDRSYIPGIIEKSDGGAILFRDIDNMPRKLTMALADFLDTGMIEIFQYKVDVDARIIALATSDQIDPKLLDHFQVVTVSYPEDRDLEKEYIRSKSQTLAPVPDYVPDIASRFLERSRRHPDLEQGASTRAGVRFVENVSASSELSGREPEERDLYNSCNSSLSHSIKVNPFSWKSNREVARNLLQDVFLGAKEEKESSSKRPGGSLRYRTPIMVACAILVFGLVAFLIVDNANPGNIDEDMPNLSDDLREVADGTNVSGGTEVTDIPDSIMGEISEETGVDPGSNATITYDGDTDSLYVQDENRTWVVENYTGRVLGQTGEGSAGPGNGMDPPHAFDNISPFFLVGLFGAMTFLATFVFDYLDMGGWIRDSRVMSSIRERFGIDWEPLTSLYNNISEKSSLLSGELEGDDLGRAVKEISTARDELYAERSGTRASLEDIADLAKEKTDQYPALASILNRPEPKQGKGDPVGALRKHLEREGLINGSEDKISFTHRISRFLVSDVDDQIMKRIDAALRGVSYQELPPLPSSEIKDVRKYRRGDSYKDIAIRETIRDAIRDGRDDVQRDNLYVYEREPEKRELMAEGDVDIVVVLDLSGSMAYGDKLWYAKQAIVVLNLIAERYGNRVGVVGFRDLSTEVTDLGSDRNTTLAEVANLLPKGGTNIAAGLRRSLDLLVGDLKDMEPGSNDPEVVSERRKQVILLTDGDATHPKPKRFAAEYARRCARMTAKYGITISVVCIGDVDEDGESKWYNPRLAQQIADIGGGRIFFVRDMKDLSPVFVSEIDELMLGSMVIRDGAEREVDDTQRAEA